MAHINLLPWRERLRAQKRREFGVMTLAMILLTVFILGYWHWHNQGLIDHQKRRNSYLETEIDKVSSRIKEIKKLEKTRKQLISRMEVVASLQSSRPQIVHLFDELVSTLPEGVYLTSVSQAGNTVTIKGRATSNARVSAYMRRIEASQWLTKPNLEVIRQNGKGPDGGNSFDLVMQQVVPKKNKGGKK